MSLALHVEIEHPAWDALEQPAAFAERAIAAALATEPADSHVADADTVEIGVRFTDDATIQDLNRDWRGKDKPTNVLSFPLDDTAPPEGAPLLLGDIVLAYETTRREADEKSIPLEQHATHLLVHATLHLLGYDHEETDEAEAMERLETQILSRMGIPDPYLAN